MKSDVAVCFNSFLNFLETTGGFRISRPLSHVLHATRPNELIHFDFLFMGPSSQGNDYILVIKDELFASNVLFTVDDTTAITAASSMFHWFSLFGVVQQSVSDEDPHFRNALMEELHRRLRSHNHFTTYSCPQSNSTTEVVCKEILRASRALLSEF